LHFIYAEVRSLSVLLVFLSCPPAAMTAMHKFLALLFLKTTLCTMALSTCGFSFGKLFHLKVLAL
jgi:hypothetical protein